MNTPETLQEAFAYFADQDRCHAYVSRMRWPDAVSCVFCHSTKIGHIKSRRMYQCKDCRKQFSVKKGTIFEDSAVPLDKWLCAVWLVTNAKNGISSYELSRSLGITQKSAWFMLHRIRLAMQYQTIDKLSGEVEVDETLIGGKARFMHAKRRAKFKNAQGKNTGSFGKVVVMGLLERNGRVRTKVIKSVKRSTLDPLVREHIETGTTVYTDALPSYESISDEYIHKTIDHAEYYAKGRIHTNGLENFWALVKRCLKGTYISVEPFHLFRYMDEQAYRYTHRKLTDLERFNGVLSAIQDRRVTYAKLTGHAGVYVDGEESKGTDRLPAV